MGTAEGTLVALVMERGNSTAWSIRWNDSLLAAIYSVSSSSSHSAALQLRKSKRLFLQGIFCSGLAYYIQGIIMKDRGPVFVTAFSPLSMVIVAIMGSFILHETLFMGRYVRRFCSFRFKNLT